MERGGSILNRIIQLKRLITNDKIETNDKFYFVYQN